MKQENSEEKSSINSTPNQLKFQNICDEKVRQLRQKRVLGMYQEIFPQKKQASLKEIKTWRSFSFLNFILMKKALFATVALFMITFLFILNLTGKGPDSALEILITKVQAASQKAPARYHFQTLKTTSYRPDVPPMEMLMDVWSDTESDDYMIIQKDPLQNKILSIDLSKEYTNFSYNFQGELQMALKIPADMPGRPNALFNFNEKFVPILRGLMKGDKDSEALNSFIGSTFFGNRVISENDANNQGHAIETTEHIDGHITVENKTLKKEEMTMTTKYLGISTLNDKKVEGLMTEIWNENYYIDDATKNAPQKTTLEFYFDAQTFEIVMAKATFNTETQTLEFSDSHYNEENPSIKIGDKSIGLGPLSEEEKTTPITNFGAHITNVNENGEITNFDPNFWDTIKVENQRNDNEDGYFISSNGIAWYSQNKPILIPNADIGSNIHSFIVSKANPAYAKDQTSAYFQGKKIERANSKSFQLVDDKYSIDEDDIFYNGTVIEGARTDNFTTYDGEYLANGAAVYYHDKVLEGADPQTFEYLGNGLAKDKNSTFESGIKK